MIVFQNPGLIDIGAVKTMGVSVKKPGSFGMFGTGIKYAIATTLRGGGSIELWRGDRLHKISSRTKEISGQPFDIVTLDGKELGFTTALGLNWESWMVLREFGCNALDEAGKFWKADGDDELFTGADGETTLIVRWDKLEGAWLNRKELFLSEREEEALVVFDGELRILPGPSDHVFYRGIRAHKPHSKRALCTYDILESMTLTEDRTILFSESAYAVIKKGILRLTDKDLLRQILGAGDGYIEHSFDYETLGWISGDAPKPTREFLDVCIELREAHKTLNSSARKILMRAMREDKASGGGYYPSRRITSEKLEYAMEVLQKFGLEIDLDKTPIIVVDELPGIAVSLLENGRIYILQSLLDGNYLDLLNQLMRRAVELEAKYLTAEYVMDCLIPKLLKTDERLADQMKLAEEEAAALYAHLEPEEVEL